MSAAVNIHLEVRSWKFEVRRNRLGEDYAFGGAGFLDGVVMGPPLLPGLRVVAERFAGDEAKGAVDPAARVGVQGIIIEKIQEIGNGGEALFVSEHAGFGDANGGALAHTRRRIMGETVEQGIDSAVGAEHGQAFDGPEARLLVAIMRESEQVRKYKFWLHAAIAQRAETPQGEGALGGIFANQFHEVRDGLGRFSQIVGGEVDLDGRATHAQIVGLHGGEHEIEQMIGIMQAAAPAIRVLADEVEGSRLVTNGKLEELFGLLLRGEAGELGEFGVYGGGGGLRGCRGACACKVAHFKFGPDGFEAADFKTGDGGEGCQDQKSQAVPAQDAERERAGFARELFVRSSHELCLALPSGAFRHKVEVAGDGNNGTGSQPSWTRGQYQ